MSSNAKTCSVVIPSMGRRPCLINCMGDLAKMNTLPQEVLVIEQGEAPAPLPAPNAFEMRQLHCKEPNASLARNIGLAEASGDIVLFLDDDVRISNPNFLKNHLRHYEDPTIPGVYGQVLEVSQEPTDQPDPSVIETDAGWMNLPANYARRCRTRNGGSGNLSVRRDLALAVGGMDAWFEKGARREETEFNLRLTKRYGYLAFDPEAGLTHLSAGGGSRTWGHVRRTVPMHHIVGHWYFLLRALCDRTLSPHGILREIRHIAVALLKNPQVGKSPIVFLRNSGRAIWGFGIALTRLARGPRHVRTLPKGSYHEIKAERVAE